MDIQKILCFIWDCLFNLSLVCVINMREKGNFLNICYIPPIWGGRECDQHCCRVLYNRGMEGGADRRGLAGELIPPNKQYCNGQKCTERSVQWIVRGIEFLNVGVLASCDATKCCWLAKKFQIIHNSRQIHAFFQILTIFGKFKLLKKKVFEIFWVFLALSLCPTF